MRRRANRERFTHWKAAVTKELLKERGLLEHDRLKLESERREIGFLEEMCEHTRDRGRTDMKMIH